MVVLWLFEIGYLIQHLATFFQIKRIRHHRNSELVSLDTNIYFLIGCICRTIWMWDSALKGFYLSYLELILGFTSLIYIIYLFNTYKHNNYINYTLDQPIYTKFYVLFPLILILSFLFHPGTKNKYYFTTQMFVSGNIFSEAIGLLPQFYIIAKSKETGNISSYYAVFLAFSRFFRLLFWFQMYMKGSSFIMLIVADVINTVLLFVFLYSMKINWGRNTLPTFGESPSSGTKKLF
jgi:hypothetical protein